MIVTPVVSARPTPGTGRTARASPSRRRHRRWRADIRLPSHSTPASTRWRGTAHLVAKAPGKRKPLTPEDAGWVGFDLVQRGPDGPGVEVLIAVPAAVAIGPVQAPDVGIGAVAELGHTYPGPLGQVRVPRRSAVEDGDRVAAYRRFDADLIAKAGRDPALAVLANPGKVDLWRFGHPTTLVAGRRRAVAHVSWPYHADRWARRRGATDEVA
jgi:hypothetical protein